LRVGKYDFGEVFREMLILPRFKEKVPGGELKGGSTE